MTEFQKIGVYDITDFEKIDITDFEKMTICVYVCGCVSLYYNFKTKLEKCIIDTFF